MATTSIAPSGGSVRSTSRITRMVTRPSVNTISSGTTVHASSMGLLPYSCTGSPCCALRRRNFTMLYTRMPSTTTKMPAQMPITSHAIDSI